jgi:hypothetical protein
MSKTHTGSLSDQWQSAREIADDNFSSLSFLVVKCALAVQATVILVETDPWQLEGPISLS